MYVYDSRGSFPQSQNLGEPTVPQVQYKEPFPNIKKECPRDHRKAMDALLAVQDMKFFEPFYKQLYVAATNAKLSLGRGDELILNPDQETLRELVVDEVGHEVAVNMAAAVAKWTFGPEVARMFPLMDLILKFKVIYEGIQNTKLVNEQDRSLREKAFEKKLSLFIDIKARALVRKDPTKDEFKLRAWLHEQYKRYAQRQRTLLNYTLWDDTHCGKERGTPAGYHQR